MSSNELFNVQKIVSELFGDNELLLDSLFLVGYGITYASLLVSMSSDKYNELILNGIYYATPRYDENFDIFSRNIDSETRKTFVYQFILIGYGVGFDGVDHKVEELISFLKNMNLFKANVSKDLIEDFIRELLQVGVDLKAFVPLDLNSES